MTSVGPVRDLLPGGDHPCPARRCRVRVPADRLCCDAHWVALPLEYRVDVCELVDGGMMGSFEHSNALAACVDWLRRFG